MNKNTAFFFVLFAALQLSAQTSPFLPEDLYIKLTNEISGDIAYDHLRTLTQFHVPNGAGRGFKAEAEWITTKAKEYGLEDVKIHQLPYRGQAWSPLSGELWLVETTEDGRRSETKLGSYEEAATSVADNSRPTKVEAELVDVGRGIEESDYEGKDVKGKIVLASGPTSDVHEEAVWKRGALGVVSYYSSRVNPTDYPDQIAWSRIAARPKDGKEPTFAFIVSPRTGMALRRKLLREEESDFLVEREAREEEKPKPRQPLRVRVTIESEIAPNPTQGIVEGWIRGSRIRDQHVVLTSHIQEERTSANDDRSGVASMLEIARSLVKLIREGKLPRPERDIRFWWVNEIDAPYTWFAEHPEDRKNIFVNINQDMVGAHQTMGGLSRVQHVTRTPWSRPTFFNDVVESIVSSLYQGNNSYLAARQARSNAPGSHYSRPIYSLLGSRDRYSAEIVPYFSNTDHMVFADAVVGTMHGGITFTNWPDEYIHSSDDDIWQTDRTQLQRNAIAVAVLTWYMANVSAKDVATIGAMFVPGALGRIQGDIRNGLRAHYDGGASDWDLENVVARAVEREYAAARSIQSVAPADASVKSAVDKLVSRFELAVTSVSESLPPLPKPSMQPIAAMASKIPARVGPMKSYMEKRRDIKAVKNFHSIMAYEALNFADGRRTVWQIYEALRAQSLASGEWYYGRVTPEMVRELFDNAEKAGAVTTKASPAATQPPSRRRR